MTQEEIRAKRQEIKDRISDLRGEIEIEGAHLNVLQRKCKHPNMHNTYHIGERGVRCPDCGYER